MHIRPIRLLLLSAAFLGLSGGLRAQDFAGELAHIRTLLVNPQSLLMETKATVDYAADMAGNKELPRVLHTVIRIAGNNYFYENEMMSMVINPQWTVGVMHAQKQIVYGRNDARGMDKAKKQALSRDVPTDPALAEKAVYLGEQDGVRHYTVAQPGGGLSRSDFYIGAASRFFTRLVNEYENPAASGIKRTTVEFLRFDDRAVFPADAFSEKMFLRFNGKTAQPAEKYKGYELIYTDPELFNNF